MGGIIYRGEGGGKGGGGLWVLIYFNSYSALYDAMNALVFCLNSVINLSATLTVVLVKLESFKSATIRVSISEAVGISDSNISISKYA